MKLPILIAVFVFFCIPAGGVRAATEPLTDDQALAIARQVVDSLNKGDTDAAYSRFNEEMKKAVTPEQLEGVWKGLIFAKGEYQGESSYAIRDVGEYTSVVLTLRFRNEEQMVVVTFSRDGRLAGLHTPPMPVKTELAPDEQEVAFTSGGNTVYGTLRLPANSAGKAPALLLISGSGPTDRDGNSRMLP
ncbi:MAG TPA: DUF3887 domain-containing protein, partial [Acidobacteriota bacterium]|nr:DUF3887 domain-containing protein [Acidobacteriota bacterium]